MSLLTSSRPPRSGPRHRVRALTSPCRPTSGLVLTSIDKGHSADISVQLALGAEVPRSVEVTTFPDRVIERLPQLRSYRYVVAQDQVIIVDPNDRQVALLIGD